MDDSRGTQPVDDGRSGFGAARRVKDPIARGFSLMHWADGGCRLVTSAAAVTLIVCVPVAEGAGWRCTDEGKTVGATVPGTWPDDWLAGSFLPPGSECAFPPLEQMQTCSP